jgi:NitT/TauT family transport system substrate-binding protein
MIPWQGTHDFYRDRTRQDGIFSAGFPNSWRPRSVLLVDVIAGLKAVGSRRLFPMRALKASGWQIFVKVRVPGMLPYLLAGLEIGIIFAIIGAIVAEFVGSSSGLGSLVIKQQSAINVVGVFSVLVYLSLTGLALNAIVQWIGAPLVFWAQREHSPMSVAYRKVVREEFMRARNLTRKMSTILIAVVALIVLSTATRAETKLVVQIGLTAPSLMSIDLYIADKAGFFKEEGLDVELRYSPNASQSAQIVASGGADIGRLSWEPLLFGYDKGLRGRIFYGLYTRFMYYVALPVDSPIRTVADLRGKKVGVTNVGSASIFVLRSMFRDAGLPPDDVTLVPVGVGELPMSMLQSKQIDALMVYVSLYSAIEAAGMPLRYLYHPVVADFGNDGYFATDRVIAQKSDAIAGFSRAIAKATVFLFANPEAAVKIYWQVDPSGKIGANDQEAMARSLKELEGDMKTLDVANTASHKYGDIDIPRFRDYMEMMVEEGAIAQRVPVEELVTDQFLAAANDFDVEQVRTAARALK